MPRYYRNKNKPILDDRLNPGITTLIYIKGYSVTCYKINLNWGCD